MFWRLAVISVALLLVPTGSSASRAQPAQVSGIGGIVHMPPVPGPVIDGYRPPPEPWLSGNRGLEYDTEPGEPVMASAAGVVTFAGAVAGSFHVTIAHDDRLRTTLAFVAEPLVAVGDRVRGGDVVAIAGDSVHFTARVDGEYIDPILLFAPHRWVVRLIPTE